VKFWTTDIPIPERISLISRRTWNGGNGEECRVVIEGGRVKVWTATGHTVDLVDDEAAVTVDRSGRGWTVGTAESGTWDVAMGGCACGSILKYHDPKGADVAG